MNTVQIVATISIITGFICTLIILIDILTGHKQYMMVMNFVWPITGFIRGPAGVDRLFHYRQKSRT